MVILIADKPERCEFDSLCPFPYGPSAESAYTVFSYFLFVIQWSIYVRMTVRLCWPVAMDTMGKVKSIVREGQFL